MTVVRPWRRPSVTAGVMGLVLLLILPLWACGGEEAGETERQVPSMMRTRFNAEMMAILRDVQLAEETARAVDGAYVDWEELRRSYLSRSIPSNYQIEMKDLTTTSYRVDIRHGPSGLSCRLEVAGAGARGSPTCE